MQIPKEKKLKLIKFHNELKALMDKWDIRWIRTYSDMDEVTFKDGSYIEINILKCEEIDRIEEKKYHE